MHNPRGLRGCRSGWRPAHVPSRPRGGAFLIALTVAVCLPTGSSAAQDVVGPTLTTIAVGRFHSCAVAAAGGVYCWGDNTFGQVGRPRAERALAVPVSVPLPRAARGVALAAFLSCAELVDDSVYCWGGASREEESSHLPRRVGVPAVRGLMGGAFAVCAIAAGDLYCWRDAASQSLAPLATDVRSADVHLSTCLVDRGRTVRCLGNEVLPSSVRADRVVLGGEYICTLTRGHPRCWSTAGARHGATSPYEVRLGLPRRVRGLAAGRELCAILPNGHLQCLRVRSGSFIETFRSDRRFRSLDVGSGHGCAVDVEGHAWCWGDNSFGQLGGAEVTSSFDPQRVRFAG